MEIKNRLRSALPLLAIAELVVAAAFGLMAMTSAHAAGTGSQHGRLIVGLEKGVDRQEQAQLAAAAGVQKELKLPGINAIVVDPAGSTDQAMNELRNQPGVRYVQESVRLKALGVPSDPMWEDLWGMQKIGAEYAWDKVPGGPVTVAVTDTGIDASHPDLDANLWRNTGEIPGNRVDDDRNGVADDVNGAKFLEEGGDVSGNPDDDHGHGTHVSGTIAAESGNGFGVVGVNPKARIMPVKFLDEEGGGSDVDAIKAIDYAVRNGAKVINASWGGYGEAPALKEAIARAGNAGVLFVASAGNESNDSDENPAVPAAFDLPNIVSVAATDQEDNLAEFSNYGATSVDLAAPGVEILSTLPEEDFYSADGTSMAAPHVAGTASLILAQNPDLTVDQLKARILQSVDPVKSLKGVTVTGGRLNAARAVGATMPKPSGELTLSGSAQRKVAKTGRIKFTVASSRPGTTVSRFVKLTGIKGAKSSARGESSAETSPVEVAQQFGPGTRKAVRDAIRKGRKVWAIIKVRGADASGPFPKEKTIRVRVLN